MQGATNHRMTQCSTASGHAPRRTVTCLAFTKLHTCGPPPWRAASAMQLLSAAIPSAPGRASRPTVLIPSVDYIHMAHPRCGESSTEFAGHSVPMPPTQPRTAVILGRCGLAGRPAPLSQVRRAHSPPGTTAIEALRAAALHLDLLRERRRVCCCGARLVGQAARQGGAGAFCRVR